MNGKEIAGLIEVRLTVDRMRHQILQILPDHAKDLEATIRREVEAACARAPQTFAEEIGRCIDNGIRETIRRVVDGVIYRHDGLRKEIEEAATKELLRRFEEQKRYARGDDQR